MPDCRPDGADSRIEREIALYEKGKTTRRELLRSLIAITGSYAAAHLFLESSGVAATLIAQREAEGVALEGCAVGVEVAVFAGLDPAFGRGAAGQRQMLFYRVADQRYQRIGDGLNLVAPSVAQERDQPGQQSRQVRPSGFPILYDHNR